MKAELLNAPAVSRSSSQPSTAAASSQAPVPPLLTKILAATDFSPLSETALDYAVALASRSGAASVRLINVVEPFPYWRAEGIMPMAPTEDELSRDWAARLSFFAAARSTPLLHVSSTVHEGEPAEEIIAAATLCGADLLVIATHGRSGLKHFLLGSIAERVVREAPCPVLVVRERQHQFVGSSNYGSAPWGLRRILVPTDFSQRSAEALQFAVRFAQQFGGRITLVHTVTFTDGFEVADPSLFQKEDLVETMRHTAEGRLADFRKAYLPEVLDVDAVVRVGSPLVELPELAKTGDFDLIICGTHGYTGLKHALLGSTAEGLLRHAPCPVLIVRNGSVHPPVTSTP